MTDRKKRIAYYVLRNKNTGFYFRGKGANRWGEYYNQASIYRSKAHAEDTAGWLNLRGESVEIVRISISERPMDEYDEMDFCGELCLFAEQLIQKAKEPNWIPVTERLPEELKPVLAWHGEGYFAECARWTGHRWESTWEFEDLTGVTHWMPLPEPPKEV